MLITHLGHACLLVEMADTRVLIDPGAFSDDLSGVRDLDAILVTHQHPDHLDPERFPSVVAANPGAVVLCDPQSVEVLATLGVEAREHAGAASTVGGVTVTPFGDQHALIHEDIPRITNVGVRLDAEGEPSFFHPGDALDAEPGEVDVLAFPLQAPWQRSRDMTAFLRRLASPHAVPVHDGLLQARGRGLYLGQAGQLGAPDTRVHDLAGQGATEFRAGE
jgi:L-ascorbate metabolism protein UlaG (beta-lactamase superfamily)